ncbi:MAG: hypothetical protein FJ147_08070 [Deltaproteobacteria bacterium]|nr:hypothetical protein [Deltaproteobacteria bacterium]
MTMHWILPGVISIGLMMCAPTGATAQISFGVGGSNVESEESTIPFRIQLKGIINGDHEKSILGVVTLEISAYQGNYDLDVTEAKALDDARITSYSILQKYTNGKRNITLSGPEHMLSKIGQATPGTPLTITGYLRQRSGTLQLIRVEAPVAEGEEKTPEEQSSAK